MMSPDPDAPLNPVLGHVPSWRAGTAAERAYAAGVLHQQGESLRGIGQMLCVSHETARVLVRRSGLRRHRKPVPGPFPCVVCGKLVAQLRAGSPYRRLTCGGDCEMRHRRRRDVVWRRAYELRRAGLAWKQVAIVVGLSGSLVSARRCSVGASRWARHHGYPWPIAKTRGDELSKLLNETEVAL